MFDEHSWKILQAIWPWLGAAALLLAAGFGFAAGHLTARWQDRRAVRISRCGWKRLYETVLRSLDSATEVCHLLDRVESRCLTHDQTGHLEARRESLLAVVARIINRQRGHEQPPAEAAENPLTFEPLIVKWTVQPTSSVSGLPDRSAFDASLSNLIEAGGKAGRCSHLLFIRTDRMPSLVSRHGQAAMNALFRKLASVICRTIRDGDLACQLGPDQLAVLMPGADQGTAQRLATTVRDAVRSHHFRVDEDGPEILLTASFGLAICLPDDRPELVLDRAAHAISRSQRLGRNQLHCHDGIDPRPLHATA